MSVSVLEKPLQVDAPPRPALRPVAHSSIPVDDGTPPNEDFQPWELHSELVFVCPDLRRRSLELLPEPASDVLAGRPRPIPVSAPAPVPAGEPAVRPVSLPRYALHRVGEMTRLGLTIVGTIFTLAMLAEVLAR
jgi:hypothetical protein